MDNAPATLLPPDEDDWSRPLAERQLQMLGELAEIGLECARYVERQTKADPASPQSPAPAADIALAYARVSRAVRQTILLQSRLIEQLKAEAADAARASVSARRQSWENRRIRVSNAVERAAWDEHPDDEDQVERLVDEAFERLGDEDFHDDLMERPIDEIVARICQDLGLAAPKRAASPPPPQAAGGGPSAERSEEPTVEGAGGARPGETSAFWASFLPEDDRPPPPRSASDSS